MASAHVLEMTDAKFDTDVLKSDKPVLVDFWAVWCVPCKAIAPKVESVASRLDGSARFYKLDVDHNPQVAMRYNVRNIPTLLIFKDGKVVDKIIGNTDEKRIQDTLAKYM